MNDTRKEVHYMGIRIIPTIFTVVKHNKGRITSHALKGWKVWGYGNFRTLAGAKRAIREGK